MFGIRIHRPSPALVVAMLALLVALSGTAYAAATLPANSVGTAQLKNGSVTMTKLALGGRGSLMPRAWAEVKDNGKIIASSGFKKHVAHAYPGTYGLTLSKRATRCAAFGSDNPNGGYVAGGIAQASFSNRTQVSVITQYYSGSDFGVSDESFSVVVYC